MVKVPENSAPIASFSSAEQRKQSSNENEKGTGGIGD